MFNMSYQVNIYNFNLACIIENHPLGTILLVWLIVTVLVAEEVYYFSRNAGIIRRMLQVFSWVFNRLNQFKPPRNEANLGEPLYLLPVSLGGRACREVLVFAMVGAWLFESCTASAVYAIFILSLTLWLILYVYKQN